VQENDQPPLENGGTARTAAKRRLRRLRRRGRQPLGVGPLVPEVQPHIEFKRVRREDAGGPTAQSSSRKALRSWRRPRLRWPVLTAAAVALVLLLGAGWVGLRGAQASGHLRGAARLFGQLQQQMQRGDAMSARTTLRVLQREIGAARAETSDPTWRLVGRAPKLGDDVTAVRAITAALDDLANHGLPPLIEVAASLETALLAAKAGPAPGNGRAAQHGQVDLAALQAAVPRIAVARTVIRQVRQRVSAISTRGLAPQIRAAMPELLSGLRRAEQITGPAENVARLLPPMLGAGGPRTYLVLFQNLAEVRATGGMPGAFIVVEADHGAIRIVDQGTAAATLQTFSTPVLPLDPDMEALHTDRLGTFPADVNLTPDFPTAAALAREMYRIRTGRTVDGVMATDPVSLSYLLRVTGPVPLPTGAPLTADTAVRMLLSEVYADLPVQAQQDAYFAGAARAVFDALLSHQGDPRALLGALTRAAGERRILVWSAHPDEEDQISRTMLAGALPADDGAEPTVGVFLNDGSGAKLGYYLSHAVTLGVGSCLPDGTLELRLKLTLGSAAPRSGLSSSVLGLGLSGDPYTVRTNVMIFSPTGGGVGDVTLDGVPAEAGTGVERARSVAVVTVDLPPGVTKTLDVTLVTDVLPPVAGPVTPRLLTTPGVAPWPRSITRGPGCTK
jgi:hypothetical protein